MAHVIRIYGSPDVWLAQSPEGWVDDKGTVTALRLLSDSQKVEFTGAEGDEKVKLLGFGGKVKLETPAKDAVKEQGAPATGSATPKK